MQSGVFGSAVEEHLSSSPLYSPVLLVSVLRKVVLAMLVRVTVFTTGARTAMAFSAWCVILLLQFAAEQWLLPTVTGCDFTLPSDYH